MTKPVISDAVTLLALLREAPRTRVVRYVRDEDCAICETEDGMPLGAKSRGIVAWVDSEAGSAKELLDAALDADVKADEPAWAALPIRYGPYCSTWTMPENPHAPKKPGSDKAS